MIAQLNLLPDVKLEYLKTTRTKRLVYSVSMIVIISSAAIILLLVSIAYVFQKKNLSDLQKDITSYNQQLKDVPDLSKILTIQNQLATLPGMHEQKAVAARLLDYIPQITPLQASITSLKVDFAANTMTIVGAAPQLDVANTYTDTLKFTTYHMTNTTDADPSTETKAFSNVVLSQFVRNNSGATFTIDFTYDPVIFDSNSAVKLSVPHIISSPSSTEQPTAIFDQGTTSTTGTNQQGTGTTQQQGTGTTTTGGTQ